MSSIEESRHVLGSWCNTVQISRKCDTKASHGRLC